MLKKEKAFNSCTHVLDFFSKYWVICIGLISFFCFAISVVFYGVNYGYYFEHIAFQQQQEMKQEKQDNFKNDFVQFHNELGVKYLYDEEIYAARDEFNQVLKADPLNQDAIRGLFECDLYNDIINSSSNPSDYNPGIIWMKLNELSKRYSNDPIPELYLGDLASKLGYKNTSLYFYQNAIKLNSSVAAAYFGMGVIYDQEQRPYLAREMFQEAVNLSNWNRRYLNNLALTCYRLKDYNNSIHWYSFSIKLHPRHLLQYFCYSSSLRCLGYLEDARYYQERQIALMEDNNTLNLTYNQEKSYFLLNSGNVIYPSNDVEKLYAYYNIALTYYLLGNETKSLEYLKKSNDLNITTNDTENVKEMLNSDIENLQQAQPKFRIKTIEFRDKFLNSS